MRRTRIERLIGRGILILSCAFSSVSAQPAEIEVDGTGWWSDRLVERSLRNLRADTSGPLLNANTVEDAAFFVMSSLAEEGYLQPAIRAEITREDGTRFEHRFDGSYAELLPRPLQATAVRFQAERGVRYHFGEVEFSGGEALLPGERAERLLVPRTGLLVAGDSRVFTPARLRRGLDQLELVLRQSGHAAAVAHVEQESRDPVTGEVDLTIVLDPGPRWIVANVTLATPSPADVHTPREFAESGRIWTVSWEQDLVEAWRTAYFEAGYPDVRVAVERQSGVAAAGELPVDLELQIDPGPAVKLGPAQFEDQDRVLPRVLSRRVQLEAGGPLNPLEIDEARRRLERLRAFSRVRLHYEPADGELRSPVFVLEPREPWEASLLMGYGSYEQVRGGFEVRGHNLLRRSHQLRVEAIGSLKSVRGEMVYTVPEVFGEAIDTSLRLFGLDREELAFQRQEYGVTIALRRRNLPWVNAEGSVSYTLQSLRNRENDLATQRTDLIDATTASVTFALDRDRRDNPLLPRTGYRWYGQLELAGSAWGSEVGFQRIEAGWSRHWTLSEGSWLHVGVSHGMVLTLGEPNDLDLPVNKRFFPGGENSLRGLRNGQAVPRDAAGAFIGAKSFSSLNLEFEQALTERISGVVFFDALGDTAQLEDLPWSDEFYTVGVGLRYRTIIGPMRLEYGHNLNPRPQDPSGTLHFSLGYPF